jgi:hypothetical protein
VHELSLGADIRKFAIARASGVHEAIIPTERECGVARQQLLLWVRAVRRCVVVGWAASHRREEEEIVSDGTGKRSS